MPFRNYSQFTSGTLKIMATAYDAVIAKLGIASSDPRTSQIAAKIASLVSEGETDVTKLCDKTCAELSKQPITRRPLSSLNHSLSNAGHARRIARLLTGDPLGAPDLSTSALASRSPSTPKRHSRSEPC